MRLLFAGTPDVAVVALDALLASEHEVVAVLTRPPAKSGRGRHLVDSAVAQRAADVGLRVFAPNRVSDPEFVSQLEALSVDCAPVVAYGALLPASVLEIPRHGWVNLHFSLLPRWRGAAPVAATIMNGDEVAGATTFRIEEGLDTGPVFGCVIEQLSLTETSGSLLQRLARSGADLLVETMDELASGTAIAVPQAADGVTFAPKLHPVDARITWASPADEIDRRIRACTPDPGAWTQFRGERVKVLEALVADPLEVHPAQIAVTRHSVTVATATDGIELVRVQPHGKKPMVAADWARGVRIETGERFD